MPCPAGSEQARQLAGCFIAKRHKINGLPPRGRFFGATRCHHLTDYGRQHNCCMLPADQVETLERLVDEVERVSGVAEHPLGLSRKQDIGEHGWRKTRGNCREQGPLGGLAMTNVGPTLQPALEHSHIGPTSKRCTFPSRRLAVAVLRHVARRVEQGKISFLLW